MEMAEQIEVAAWLGDPRNHGPEVDSVERIDTHGAMVFLAGQRAYKIKRAVKFPYMDFSTLALRRAACEREVELNRRTAPDLYLGVVPVKRAGDGRLSLGGGSADDRRAGPGQGGVPLHLPRTRPVSPSR